MATEAHIEKLDKKISALSDALAHLGNGTDLKELLRIIRNPGWTTPAELGLTIALLDSMTQQTAQLAKSIGALKAAAAKVGAKGR